VYNSFLLFNNFGVKEFQMASSSLNSGLNYIYDKNPKTFGNSQSYYQEQVSDIVESAATTVHEAVESKGNIEALFHALLDSFNQKRQEIAITTKTVDAPQFGRRRDLGEAVEDGHSYTVLSQKYAEYGDTMCGLLQSKLSKMPHDFKGFHKPRVRESSKCMNRLSSFEVEVLDSNALIAKGWMHDINIQDLIKVTKGVSGVKEKLQLLKKMRPDLYKQDRMHFFLMGIHNAFPSPKSVYDDDGGHTFIGDEGNLKSHWVLATTRVEINKKMYALSQYLTFMYCNHREDPVERMTGKAKVTVIHQDMLLVEETLKDIAKIFSQAVSWDSKTSNTEDLIGRVSLFKYLFAHCMPTTRGSAAVNEWFEKTIYKYHGFEVNHAPGKASDLEALTSDSLGDFVERYKGMIKVTPLNSD
jgi:Avirulence protein